jgi:hypothetical protein
LIDKVTLEQMLPEMNRFKRGILVDIRLKFKFLFVTALSEYVVNLEQKVEDLRTQQGNLLQPTKQQ